MTVPKVTVLMSVFNGIEYLEQAIGTILNQSFRDFEFLIINDGSTQPVIPVIESFADPRIIVVNQDNRGLPRSLNKGLSLSRGEYIARMDSDDVSLPNRLEKQLSAMESNRSLELVGSFYEVIDRNGRVCEVKRLIEDAVYRLWRLQFHNVYGHGTVMLRRSALIKAGGYDEALTFAQDYDLWSRLSRIDNTLIVPEVLYRYRLAESGTQSSVAHYDAQLANAVRISDRNLRRCNPGLSHDDCAEVRAVFWKFQRPNLSDYGLNLLGPTLKAFMAEFSLAPWQSRRLVRQVVRDVFKEIDNDPKLPEEQKESLTKRFEEIVHRLFG